MAKFTASVVINAKSNLDKVAQKTSKSMAKMNRSFNLSSFRTQQLSADLARLTKRAALLGAAGFGAAIVQGAKFQASIQDLSALTGLGGDSLKFLGDEAQKLGEKYGVSSGKVVASIKQIGSARSDLLKDPPALLNIAENSIILAKAQRMELQPAVEAMMTTLNQFVLPASDAGRVMNTLAAGSKVGAAEVDIASKSMERAGVAARSVKISMEETTAAIQVLAQNGRKGEMAGTALRAIFSKLATKGIDRLNPKIVGLHKSLENLAPYKENEKALSSLFGEEYWSVAKILIENRDLLDEWTGAVTDTSVAMEQAAKNMNTVGNDFSRIGSMIQNDFVNVFLDNEAEISAVVDRLVNKFEKFRPIQGIMTGISDAILRVSTSLLDLSDRFESERTFLGKLDQLTGFTSFTDAFKGEGSIFGDVSTAKPATSQVELRILSREDIAIEKKDANTDIFILPEMGGMLPSTP